MCLREHVIVHLYFNALYIDLAVTLLLSWNVLQENELAELHMNK